MLNKRMRLGYNLRMSRLSSDGTRGLACLSINGFTEENIKLLQNGVEFCDLHNDEISNNIKIKLQNIIKIRVIPEKEEIKKIQKTLDELCTIYLNRTSTIIENRQRSRL